MTTPYALFTKWFGVRVANALMIVLHALLIVMVVLLSDKDFSRFTYLRL